MCPGAEQEEAGEREVVVGFVSEEGSWAVA